MVRYKGAEAIKLGMGKMGFLDKTSNLLKILDQLELDRELQIGIDQLDRGEGIPFEDFMRDLDEKFANGYYSQENIRKRIAKKTYC